MQIRQRPFELALKLKTLIRDVLRRRAYSKLYTPLLFRFKFMYCSSLFRCCRTCEKGFGRWLMELLLLRLCCQPVSRKACGKLHHQAQVKWKLKTSPRQKKAAFLPAFTWRMGSATSSAFGRIYRTPLWSDTLQRSKPNHPSGLRLGRSYFVQCNCWPLDRSVAVRKLT